MLYIPSAWSAFFRWSPWPIPSLDLDRPHYYLHRSFPGGSAGKNPPANAGSVGSIPGWERSPGEGNGNPFHYACLGNPTDRGAWWATVLGVTTVGYNLVSKQQLSASLYPFLCFFICVCVFPNTSCLSQYFNWFVSSPVIDLSTKIQVSWEQGSSVLLLLQSPEQCLAHRKPSENMFRE